MPIALIPGSGEPGIFWLAVLLTCVVYPFIMPLASRGIVWSLLTAIVILLLGIMGLLYVSYNRDKQFEREIQNLRLKLGEKEAQIERLQSSIRAQMIRPDTAWAVNPDTSLR